MDRINRRERKNSQGLRGWKGLEKNPLYPPIPVKKVFHPAYPVHPVNISIYANRSIVKS
jgi:hypothetical protein